MTLLRKAPLKRSAFKAKKPLSRKRPSLSEVKKRFGLVTAAMLGDAPVKRKPMKKRSDTNDGWLRWAIENVWDKRDHKCEVCGSPLPEPAPIVFSHLLPRGSYRRYKTDERNVVLKCPEHHQQWHEAGPDHPSFDRDWKAVCMKYYALRDEANGVN